MTFSIRSLLLFIAAIAVVYPIVRSSSTFHFLVWLIIGCLLWGAAGITLRQKGSRQPYFAFLGLVPLLIAFADNTVVAVCDGWSDVTIVPSLPADVDASNTTLHYVALHRRDMLPFVLEHGTELSEAVAMLNISHPLKLRTGYSWRCSQFGNIWGHACEYDIVVFLATTPDGTRWRGIVELPEKYDPRPFSIQWEDATEQSGEREPPMTRALNS